MGVGSTVGIVDLSPSDPGAGGSSLLGDVEDEGLGSMEALCHCSALGVKLSGSPQDLLSLP